MARSRSWAHEIAELFLEHVPVVVGAEDVLAVDAPIPQVEHGASGVVAVWPSDAVSPTRGVTTLVAPTTCNGVPTAR
jgi:hypothetical protein